MSRDLQRVARGLGMIAMEAARTQGPEAMQCMRSTAHNVQGFLRSLEAAARAYRGGSGSHAPSSAAGDAAEATDLFAAGAGADPAASSWQQQQQQQPQQPPTLAAAHAPAPPAMDLAVAAGLKAEPLPAAPPAFSAPAFYQPPPPPAPPLAQQQQQQQQQQPASAAPLAAAEPPPAPPAPRKKRVFREVSVPASPLARLWGFGSLAASMAAGAVGEALVSAVSGGRRPSAAAEAAAAAPSASAPALSAGAGAGAAAAAPPPPARDTSHQIHLSPAQAERLAEGLCRLRGAALKLGQMLSLADETLIPPSIASVLERVRSQADVMPTKQLHAQLAAELGEGWRARLGGEGFGEAPVAAASIGQVHRALLSDGRAVAVKVQYPGVAESIDSDLDNLKRLLTYANFLPKGLYLDPMVEVARAELRLECDYEHEAAAQRRYKLLVAADPDFVVPGVVDELSTRRVLTTTWLPGVPIDQVVEATGGLGQEDRNRIARKLLKLTLKELFEWRYMQTDPNWGNFFYDAETRKIGLLDFGATREYKKEFVDDYLRLVWAAAQRDRATIEEVSLRVGFITGHESRAMLNAHVESGLVVGEPFVTHAPFDFKASGITSRVAGYGSTFAEERLTAPPPEVYSLHRKLAGAFLICIRMGAVISCRDMLEEFYHTHEWGTQAPDSKRKIVVQ